MILHPPFQISSRLLPSLQIGNGTVSLKYERDNREGRMVFRWFIDIPEGEFSEADLKSGVGGASLQDMFGSLLSFLGAAAEAYDYTMRTGRESENEDLFPKPVMEWAYQNSDEITMILDDIEEREDLIQ